MSKIVGTTLRDRTTGLEYPIRRIVEGDGPNAWGGTGSGLAYFMQNFNVSSQASISNSFYSFDFANPFTAITYNAYSGGMDSTAAVISKVIASSVSQIRTFGTDLSYAPTSKGCGWAAAGIIA